MKYALKLCLLSFLFTALGIVVSNAQSTLSASAPTLQMSVVGSTSVPPYSIEAVTNATGDVRVEFYVDGLLFRNEGNPVYSCFGGDIAPVTGRLGTGSHKVEARLYQQTGSSLLATAVVTIQEGASSSPTPSPTPAAAISSTSVVVPNPTPSSQVLADNFETTNPLSPWTFNNGSEYPGATGYLSTAVGRSGNGICAKLSFDLTGGGRYVMASRTFSSPISARTLSLWLQNDAGTLIFLRVVDETGQTFQYPLSRSFESTDASKWYQHVVDLNTSTEHWSGANDGVIHGKIAKMSILLHSIRFNSNQSAPTKAVVTGKVQFDDITLCDPPVSGVPLTRKLSVNTTSYWSVPAPSFFSSLGVDIKFNKDDLAMDLARDAGLRVIRRAFFWETIEPSKGVYSFSSYDPLVTAAESRGMKVLALVAYGNRIYTGSTNDKSPSLTTAAQITAFGNYVRALTAHYAGRKVQFEIWNESNHTTYWPSVNPVEYANLAKEAIRQGHAGNPSALISTAGTSTLDFDYIRRMLDAGAGTGTNAIGIHPYFSGAPETNSDSVVFIRSLFTSRFSTPPALWSTECGYSSTWFGSGTTTAARDSQGVYVARQILTHCLAGFTTSIIYDLIDDGTDPARHEDNFGLLTPTYAKKAAYTATKTLTGFAAGRTVEGTIPTALSSLHALRLKGANDTVVVLWGDSVQAQYKVRIPLPKSVVDVFGKTVSYSSGGGDTYDVLVGDSPIYVTFWSV
jgi:hypothetical protein